MLIVEDGLARYNRRTVTDLTIRPTAKFIMVRLILTAVVEDPQYLNGPFIRSTHYKRLANTDTAWEPEPCSAK